MPDTRKSKAEADFLKWYQTRAARLGLDPNPYNPEHHYDYKAAYRAGAEPDSTGHWPSQFKSPDHPRRYLPIGPGGAMVDTITMKPVESEQMPNPKKDKKYDDLVAALRSLEAQKMAQMAALNATPAPAAQMYAPLVQATRSQHTPRNAQEAAEYGRKWNQQHVQQALEDYSYLPEGGQKPAYLEELKRRGVLQQGGQPTGSPGVPYKMAPEMKITAPPQVDVNLDEIYGRGNPKQYIPTQEYPGQTGVYSDRASNTVFEPVPKDQAEKDRLIEEELHQRKWENRFLPEFQTPERRLIYKL